MIDYTWYMCGGTGSNHPPLSEPFVLQLFNQPELAVNMTNQSPPAREPPKHQESAKPDGDAVSAHSELDQYSAEVLEAVLGILKARRKAERRQT